MTAGDWAAKWRKAGAETAAAMVETVAVAAERVGVVQQRRPRGVSRDAEKELARRDEINARGAEARAERDATFGRLLDGRARWIHPRPNWFRRRG